MENITNEEKIELISNAVKKLESINKNCDNEGAHRHADKVLLKLLQKVGFEEVVKAYIKGSKAYWYS